ncbi:hypothetical protein FACS1894137_13270 [Spirochaetia bacterium]|nr:hypothetical protein FACS1894137_13270 [Spirochaetia bacterium]
MNSIKTRLREYLRNKGITPNEQGMIPCLWHDDHNPSCKVYEDHFYCFTCNESGDIYTAAAALLDVPCDKEHFPAIARDVEAALGIVSDWKPAKRRPGEPRSTIKLSQSAVFWSEIQKEGIAALNGGDLERAFNKASLLLALFMLPDGTDSGGPEKPKRTMQDKVSAYCGVSL